MRNYFYFYFYFLNQLEESQPKLMFSNFIIHKMYRAFYSIIILVYQIGLTSIRQSKKCLVSLQFSLIIRCNSYPFFTSNINFTNKENARRILFSFIEQFKDMRSTQTSQPDAEKNITPASMAAI